jgi:hypothetical protein
MTHTVVSKILFARIICLSAAEIKFLQQKMIASLQSRYEIASPAVILLTGILFVADRRVPLPVRVCLVGDRPLRGQWCIAA